MTMPSILTLLEVVFDDLPYGISVGTPNGKVVCYNRAMERISGYSRDQVNASGWFDLCFPDPEQRNDAVRKAKRSLNGQLRYAETEIVCRDGQRRHVAFFLADTVIDHRKYNFGIMIPLDELNLDEETVLEDAYGLYQRLQIQVESLN